MAKTRPAWLRTFSAERARTLLDLVEREARYHNYQALIREGVEPGEIALGREIEADYLAAEKVNQGQYRQHYAAVELPVLPDAPDLMAAFVQDPMGLLTYGRKIGDLCAFLQDEGDTEVSLRNAIRLTQRLAQTAGRYNGSLDWVEIQNETNLRSWDIEALLAGLDFALAWCGHETRAN